MAWVIDRDYLWREGDDLPKRVGVGQGDLTGETYRFRLRDEDGEIHYGGRCDAAAADDDEAEGGLYQAYRWGMADTGATELELHRDDALRLRLSTEEFVDRHTTDGWTTIYG
jgi:hypothetical protein